MFLNLCSIMLISITLCSLAGAVSDWRLDLLRSQGIPTTRDSLEKTASGAHMDKTKLDQAYQKLGSENYQEREQAQAYLKSQGHSILGYLAAKAPDTNPEIRSRSGDIRQQLEVLVIDLQKRMTIAAARSLLKSPNDNSTDGQFYEWFGTESADCTNGYRQLVYEGPMNVKPFVKTNQLLIPGNCLDDTDQRMILRASTWPATKELPTHMSVSCLAGCTEKASAYHLGITIGKIKALIHPGLPGGGFRFEQIGTLHKYTGTLNMGYTPAHNQLHSIKLTAQHIRNDKVLLTATVSTPKQEPFETSIELNREDIGGFNQISLDRSGRTGGNVYFDELRVQIIP